ncbi:MAG: preprotein translocase subunit SecG [Planctomycetota bacterium]
MTTFVRVLLGSMLVLTSLFMILLVLVQRGRGGGLAGALGGMGGQSAFGTKAGDLFTRITVGVAGFWILLCLLATNMLGRQQSLISSDLGGAVPQATTPMTPDVLPQITPTASETQPEAAVPTDPPAAAPDSPAAEATSPPAAAAPAEKSPPAEPAAPK